MGYCWSGSRAWCPTARYEYHPSILNQKYHAEAEVGPCIPAQSSKRPAWCVKRVCQSMPTFPLQSSTSSCSHQSLYGCVEISQGLKCSTPVDLNTLSFLLHLIQSQWPQGIWVLVRFWGLVTKPKPKHPPFNPKTKSQYAGQKQDHPYLCRRFRDLPISEV